MLAKKFSIIVGFIIVIILFYWFFFLFSFNGGCIMMIQKARNPITKEVRVFPTPCDVPIGWQKLP